MTRSKQYFSWFGALAVLYISLSLTSPVDPTTLTRYDITALQVKLLTLSISLPYILIWFAAFYGFIKLKEYVTLIHKNRDGKAWETISNGLMVLAFGLPISAILSQLFNFWLVDNPGHSRSVSLITSYTNIILAATAFTLISRGAQQLIKLTKKVPRPTDSGIYIVCFVAITFIYGYLALFGTPANSTADDNIYSTSRWLVVVTIVLPYLYIWWQGMLAAFYMHHFKKNVPGTLYRLSLRLLVRGIIGVILSSVLLQFLATKSNRLISMRLAILMLIIYGLLLSLAVGYGYLAMGANRLKKIEEV